MAWVIRAETHRRAYIHAASIAAIYSKKQATARENGAIWNARYFQHKAEEYYKNSVYYRTAFYYAATI